MLSNLPAFILAMSLLTITPGLDTLLVIRNTTRGGLRDGFITSLGICLGLYVHATWSAIGVAAIISQTPALFAGLKTVGALYLVYLGVSGLRSLSRGSGLVPSEISLHQVSQVQSLKEGFLSNVLNPKTAIFYLAFLPQFINQEYSIWLQSMLLASIHFILAMVWQCSLAMGLEKAKNWLASNKVNFRLQLATSLMLLGLGIQLIVSVYSGS